MIVSKSKGCLGYPQGYKMERFAKIVTGFYPITIVPNHSMLDVCRIRYASIRLCSHSPSKAVLKTQREQMIQASGYFFSVLKDLASDYLYE